MRVYLTNLNLDYTDKYTEKFKYIWPVLVLKHLIEIYLRKV